MNTVFVYFSSGSNTLHNRTILSVLSLTNNCNLTNNLIFIYTDNAPYYQKIIPELPIEYYYLPQAEMQKMMGEDDLIHRVKIGIIEKTMQKYPHHKLFYVDSDTFFYKPIDDLLKAISPDVAIMHKKEYSMEALSTYTIEDKDGFYRVYQALKNNTFKVQNQEKKLSPESFDSWNAGIIGMHPSHFNLLSSVYELTDQLYAQSRNHACEQYAFSYFLQKNTKLIDCETYNRHYWHRVEKRIVDEFLAKKLNDKFMQLSLSEKKERTAKWCIYLLNKIPKHAYTHRYNAMIAFQEKRYWQGYKNSLKTLLANPLQDLTFFKDVAYYTKKMFLSR